MTKKTKVLALCGVCAAMGIGLATTAGGTMGFGGTQIAAVQHDPSHTLTEKAYTAPTTESEGYKPYWHCAECCKVSADLARYDFVDKTTNVALGDIVMPKLTAATKESVPENDLITTINTQKFKYVDQGVAGPEATSDKKESTPVYVKDGDKTALFFSRSGKTGETYNATSNDYCSEFRFSPSGYQAIASVTFSYRYLDYGKGVWAGTSSASEPAGWHSMIQFKDGSYYGKSIEFVNDDQWHTVTIAYNTYESAGNKDLTTNFSDIIFKFVDLRGHFYISGLSFEAPVSVTLKNVNADGTEATAQVLKGKLPTTPTTEGKTFAGWYDEEGNKVEAVNETTTLIARWKVRIDGFIGETLHTFDVDNDALYGIPEGVEKKLSARGSNNIKGDLDIGYYSYEKGYQDGSFVGMQNPNDYDGTVGVTMPAYDFSASDPLTFDVGFNSGHDNNDEGKNSPLVIDGNEVGYDCDRSVGYTVKIAGQAAEVYNKTMDKTFMFNLSEDVYYGREGLSFTSKKAKYRFFICTPFKSLLTDYVSEAIAIEAGLPKAPTKGDGYLDSVRKYQTLRAFYSEEEVAIYPISAKMNAWIEAATPTTVMEFADKGASILKSATGTEKGTAVVASGYTDKANCLQYSVKGCDGKYLTFTLPAYNYSEKARVTFSMGLGGGPGDKTAKYWLGAIPETADQYPMPNSLKALDNFIGTAPSGEQNSWSTVDATTVTIKDGKINFLSSSFDKTFDLDEEINTGAKGLTLTFGWCSWNTFVISPLTATQI